jgi:hypothetical protein
MVEQIFLLNCVHKTTSIVDRLKGIAMLDVAFDPHWYLFTINEIGSLNLRSRAMFLAFLASSIHPSSVDLLHSNQGIEKDSFILCSIVIVYTFMVG